MFDIKPYIDKNLSCQQALLVSYAKYIGCSADMIFAESWGFGYNKEEKLIGIKMNPGYRPVRLENFKIFHGINTTLYDIADIKELMEFYRSNISKSPMIIDVDVYNCNWNIAYRKYNIKHYCLITGYDANNEAFICIDPFSTADKVYLPIEELNNWQGKVSVFEQEAVAAKRSDYIDELNKCIYHINDSEMFSNLEEFRRDMTYTDSIYSEVSAYEDYFAVPLQKVTKAISGQRNCYLYFLDYVSKVLNWYPFDELKNIFKNSARLYDSLRISIAKQTFAGKINSSKISYIIDEIINSEKRAYDCLTNILNTNI
jgi:hypothetical protein